MFQNSNPISTAKACFNENTRLFVKVNRTANPENYNLYTGLQHLVAAVEAMQRDIEEIKAYLASPR
jgi:hypothetical protein